MAEVAEVKKLPAPKEETKTTKYKKLETRYNNLKTDYDDLKVAHEEIDAKYQEAINELHGKNLILNQISNESFQLSQGLISKNETVEALLNAFNNLLAPILASIDMTKTIITNEENKFRVGDQTIRDTLRGEK